MPNTCPICKQSISEEAQFCPICGHSFSEEQNDPETGACPNCGESYNFPEPAFCGSCGYDLSQPEPAPLFTPMLQPVFEDRLDSISGNPIANDAGESEESYSGKNTYLAAAAVLGILLVIGIALVGTIVLSQKNGAMSQNPNPTPNMNAAYTAIWETALASVEQTSSPTFTAVPSPTWTPQPTPSLIPTDVPISAAQKEKEVEDFIYFYWELIDKRDFNTAWLYQSTRFKKEVNQNDFDTFANGFQYTKNVTVLWVEAVNVTEHDAIVDANLQFVAIDNKQGAATSHRYTLVKQDDHWVIDTVVKISTAVMPTISQSNNCTGSRGGRLHIGDTARIIVFQLSIRDAPGGEQYGQRLNVLAQGQKVTIIEGPVCVAGMYFVKIQSEIIEEVGWVAEGDSKDYYLEPIQ